MTVYYEDLSVGDTMQFGTYEVTAEEIVAFAEQYDPQWFHVDAERAREESHFGDLAASGWHTAAMSMRLLVDEHLSEAGVSAPSAWTNCAGRTPRSPASRCPSPSKCYPSARWRVTRAAASSGRNSRRRTRTAM